MGRRYVITGGTGSFGHGFLDHLMTQPDWPSTSVYVMSRDEQKQQAMRAEYPSDQIRFLLGDVRDYSRVARAIREGDIVIHAAALKIVPSGEYNPDEIIKTNILGTQNVVDACMDKGASHLLCISSDKAVAPVNLYGNTKACLEKLTALSNNFSGTTRMSVVRYGNVLGSRGSIFTLLRTMADRGEISMHASGMTRFWMTMTEATDFVANALAFMKGGEIFVPKIKAAVVDDLCRYLYPDTPIKYAGIRGGDKMHEWLSNEYEVLHDEGWAYRIDPTEWLENQPPLTSDSCVMVAEELLKLDGFSEAVELARQMEYLPREDHHVS